MAYLLTSKIDEFISNEQDFQEWKQSMAIETRSTGGLSIDNREKLWVLLAKKYITSIHLNWEKTREFAFSSETYPEDEQLNTQIVKDLHRTGCKWSSIETNRILLQRVLLAFARYNKTIGYCQGLHILTSVILDVVHMNEEYALMILIYLIDSLLPDFFSNNLHALAIDMIVFDHWLKIYNPQLHLHLQKLQTSNEQIDSTYEPPLLNVFTIQWFLTLFATCLPRSAMLRVWDVLMIEGSEVLFRTGLILWSKLSIAVLKVTTADQFYSAMGHLSVQLLDEKIIIADNLIQDIYNLGPFPTGFLSDLRQKIQISENLKLKQLAVDQSKSSEIKRIKPKLIDDDVANFISCFAILSKTNRNTNETNSSPDINQLREQYKKLKQRNKQVQIIAQCSDENKQQQLNTIEPTNKTLINHLLVKPTDVKRNQYKLKRSNKTDAENLDKEIDQLITCLNLDKSHVAEAKSSGTTTDAYIHRLITTRSNQIPKYSSFNPFPSRSFNENVAVNGYKLGLYSPVLSTR